MFPETMPKLVDTHYSYQPPGARHQTQCGVRIYRHRRRKSVILTELANNPGMSITNASEQLATELAKLYKLNPAKTIWIEHYPPLHGAPETFDAVTFTWRGRRAHEPVWRRVTPQWVTYWSGERGITNRES